MSNWILKFVVTNGLYHESSGKSTRGIQGENWYIQFVDHQNFVLVIKITVFNMQRLYLKQSVGVAHQSDCTSHASM